MTGYVYAISNGRGAVKIGWSADPVRRLREMNTHDAATLSLVGYAVGEERHEREIHTLLRPARIRGEWFREDHRHVSAFLSMLPNRGVVVEFRGADAPVKGLSPAADIIQKFGGVASVAKITGAHKVRVYNWTYPKTTGGTGGTIPQRHIPVLLKAARDSGIPLEAGDFLPSEAAQ